MHWPCLLGSLIGSAIAGAFAYRTGYIRGMAFVHRLLHLQRSAPGTAWNHTARY